jgi:predicted O-methyltransferase YrrM
VNLHGSPLGKNGLLRNGSVKRKITWAGVKLEARSARIPNVNQSAAQKYRLLFKLLFSRPCEFFDRVKTAAEGLASPPQSSAGAKGLDLAAMLDLSSKYLGMELSGFLHEPGAKAIREHIASERALLNRPESAAMHDADAGLPDFCYVICRALKPRVVVETGVGSGVTTSFILQALAANNEGHLWSIDLPPIGAEQFAGSFVPHPLRNRWTLLRGRSRALLPRLLSDLPAPDVFLHDSLHTTRNMTFEFKAAWQKMNASAVLLSDDIHMSKAYSHFITGQQIGLSLVGKRFGVAFKR